MTNDQSIDRPFPLKRLFMSWIIPGLLIFVGILIFTTYRASQQVIQDIYLQQATLRAEGIARGVAASHPEAWQTLVSGKELTEENLSVLSRAFDDERHEFNLSKVKVYDLRHKTIFSTDTAQIGHSEDNDALSSVLRTGEPQVKIDKPNTLDELYELYVPFQVEGNLVAVFEIYEPSSHLNTILGNAALPVLLIPGSFLVALLIALSLLVFAAQRAINTRTTEVNNLRGRLEGLVSRRAVAAMRREGAADGILSEAIFCTLFYSDVRSFTGFSETHSPKQVIEFLNKIMSLQIAIIERHSGDVDKMIGDALFARFHDDGKEGHAVSAAIEIQTAIRNEGYEPGIGIGIFSGDVIAGGIGAENRRDYTVIGDSVNVSARLCSLASEGEIVCDAATLGAAGAEEFSDEEMCEIKGRTGGLKIQRYQP